ncbi:hypothetical protein [Streptomyces celluloflavus]|uniref:hypothetical protein n=1 Tax=Streptomyces celluloflavus TaxID=58344 RepID=UPI00367472AA
MAVKITKVMNSSDKDVSFVFGPGTQQQGTVVPPGGERQSDAEVPNVVYRVVSIQTQKGMMMFRYDPHNFKASWTSDGSQAFTIQNVRDGDNIAITVQADGTVTGEVIY